MAFHDDRTRLDRSAPTARGRRPVAVGRTLPRRRHLRRSIGRPADDDRRRGALLLLLASLLVLFFVAAFRLDPRVAGDRGNTGAVPTPTAAAARSPAPDPASQADAGSSPSPSPQFGSASAGPPSSRPPSPPAATQAPPMRTPRPAPSPASVLSAPSAAVVAFYDAVEAHDWGTAIGLWSASMQRRYPPGEWLIGRFSRTTRIDILSVHRVAFSQSTARVAVSIREYRTVAPSRRRFIGFWDLVLVDGRWLLDRPHF